MSDPRFERDGKYFFWDETWSNEHGPFTTAVERDQMLADYVQYLEHGSEFDVEPDHGGVLRFDTDDINVARAFLRHHGLEIGEGTPLAGWGSETHLGAIYHTAGEKPIQAACWRRNIIRERVEEIG